MKLSSIDGITIRSGAGNLRIIALGFLAIIFTGAALLSLPVSSAAGEWTPYFDSLFTATSATCVTGLVVYDTYTHWSVFGQIIILAMIQVGGIGFMSIITIVSIFMGRRISLHERKLLMLASGNTRLSGMITLARHIIFGTMAFEGIGAALLAIRFCPEFGFGRGLYYAVFHSVSAFCNAGFDLMGIIEPGSSLTHFRSDPIVNLTICGLIIIGGLGFMVWGNIIKEKLNIHRYSLHSKIVLSATAVLILGGAALFFMFEYSHTLAGMSPGEKCMTALFESVTPRTAGFNTVDLSAMSESGSLLTTVLMLIGGSPGSTAGGIKTTTIVVVLMTAIASARKNECVTMFKKRFNENTLRQASAVCLVYIAAAAASAMIICAIEPLGLKEALFEVASAIGTVGLSMGVTPQLTTVSRALLILLMFAGRVGGLTLMLVLIENKTPVSTMRPKEDILIG